MSTQRRVWFKGATYHVTARGNRKSNIFKEDKDYNVYLKMMEEALEYYQSCNYKILAYCLMTNHIHLIIKTDSQPLGLLMSRIQSIYTRYFNRKYDYVGHLFQGRYFSELIEDDSQLLETSRYVHLNPVKANIVQRPIDYKWSSYSTLVGKRDDKLIDSSILLEYFNYKSDLYKEFVGK